MLPPPADEPGLLRRVLEKGLKWTGHDARGDAFVESTWRLTHTRTAGQPQDAHWRYEEGAALRCWHGSELFFSAAPGPPAEALATCLARLAPAWGAGAPPADPWLGADPSAAVERPASPPDWGAEAARYLAGVERELSKSLSDCRLDLSLVQTARRIQVATDEGAVHAAEWNWVRLRLCIRRREGGTPAVWAGGAAGLDDLRRSHPASALGPILKRRLAGLEARENPVCRPSTPILFAAGAAALPLHELVHGLESDTLSRGWSAWTPWQESPRSLSPLLTLWDDPAREGLRGSYAVDDEGSPCDHRLLVRRGKIVGCLADRRGAERLEGTRPGHGRRSSWQEWPLPRAANLCMAGGEGRVEEVRQEPGTLLEILEIEKAATDPASGEMSLTVADGRWLQRGRVMGPVSGLVLEGNVLELALAVDRVCSDRRCDPGAATCGREESGIPIGFLTPSFRSKGLQEVSLRGGAHGS